VRLSVTSAYCRERLGLLTGSSCRSVRRRNVFAIGQFCRRGTRAAIRNDENNNNDDNMSTCCGQHLSRKCSYTADLCGCVDCNNVVYLYSWCLISYPPYLAEEFRQSSDVEARRRLRSASSSSLVVRRTRLSTVADRSFPTVELSAPAERHVGAVTDCFRKRLTTHLFNRSFSQCPCIVPVASSYTTIDLLLTYFLFQLFLRAAD